MIKITPFTTVLCLGTLLISWGTGAAALTPLTFTIGESTGNPGSSCEVGIDLEVGDTAPSTIVLFIEYDPDKLAPNGTYYQFTQEGLEGATETVTAAARPESAITAAGKTLVCDTSLDGVMSLVILGGTTTLGNGSLVTVAFDVLSETVGEEIDVVVVDGSAATPSAGEIPINAVDGAVLVGCDPADTPAGVAASQHLEDYVEVTWDAVATANAEYRVYRSETDDPATAQPLGSAWQAETEYADATAAGVPDVGGCCPHSGDSGTIYYYWVKARAADGCEGELSAASAVGFRTGGKSYASPASVAGDPLIMLAGLACIFLVRCAACRLRRA